MKCMSKKTYWILTSLFVLDDYFVLNLSTKRWLRYINLLLFNALNNQFILLPIQHSCLDSHCFLLQWHQTAPLHNTEHTCTLYLTKISIRNSIKFGAFHILSLPVTFLPPKYKCYSSKKWSLKTPLLVSGTTKGENCTLYCFLAER